MSTHDTLRPTAAGVPVWELSDAEGARVRNRVTGERDLDITSIESRWERWRQLAPVAPGVAAIWLGDEIATWARAPDTVSVRLWTSAVVPIGLDQAVRAVSRFVVSVFLAPGAVLRCRHLAACAVFHSPSG